MRKTHDYVREYRGYWSDGGVCRIRIYREEGREPLVVCSQLPENDNTSVTNMAEYIAAEVIERHRLPTPLVWIEHYPEHAGEVGEWSRVRFSTWVAERVRLGGAWRTRIGTPVGRTFPPNRSTVCLGAPARLPDAASSRLNQVRRDRTQTSGRPRTRSPIAHAI